MCKGEMNETLTIFKHALNKAKDINEAILIEDL